MSCRCDRRIRLGDGTCLKCGREPPDRAQLAKLDRVRQLAENDEATLARLGIADYRAAFHAAAELPPDVMSDR